MVSKVQVDKLKQNVIIVLAERKALMYVIRWLI